MELKSAQFRTEVRLDPGIVLAALALLGFGLVAVAQVFGSSTRVREGASWLAVATMGVAFIGWAYAVEHPQVARWFTAISFAVLAGIAAWAFEEPSLLTLASLAVLLAGNMLGWPAALGMSLGQTLAIVALLAHGTSEAVAGSALVAAVSVWVAMAMVWYEHGRLRRLSDWIAWHYERSERHLAEARDQREETARTTLSLAQANRQLAQANERTAILRRAAEDAHQAKAAFVANVSHEFRTPLNMIIGLVQLMVESPEIYASIVSPKMRRDLETVHRNCLHLASMVDDVLDLTRTEAGRVTLHRVRVDLAGVIRRSADTVRPLLNEKNLGFDLRLADDLPQVYCDRTRVQQVILNLLSNAARFTDAGGIEIDARCDDGSVVVSVSDTGPGIAPEDRERVFEPFWQSQGPLQARRGGTGLGLSISREFVQLHGGRMWIESEVGRGTTFHFSLPVSPPMGPVARPGHSIREDWVWREEGFRSAADVASAGLFKPRLVFCDVSRDSRPMMTHEDDGMEVVSVETMDEAIGAAEALSPQALVLSGHSVAEILAAVSRVRSVVSDVPVVAFAMGTGSRPDLEGQINGYLIKPVMRDDLLKALESVDRPVQRVLLVDDDADVLDLLTLQLGSHTTEMEVHCAQGGRDALSRLARHSFDALLLDIIMPDMSGWEVLERAKQEGWLVNTAVYIVSAQDPVDHEPVSEVIMLADGDRGVAASGVLDCTLRLVQALRQR